MNCDLKVNLRTGASVVKVRPLFSRDSKYIIIASGSDVKVFNIHSGECIQTLRHHSTPVISLQENKKNSLQIFSCSTDGKIIRWDFADGKALQTYDLHNHVEKFYVPAEDSPWFIIKKVDNLIHYRLYSLVARQAKITNIEMVLKPVLPEENATAFGFKGTFVASIQENALAVYSIEAKKTIIHKTNHNLKCVSCHPSDYVVATGDDLGQVLVWSNIFANKKIIRSIYHWHTLPVADLIFSTEGSYLYSGGGEAALVKWSLFSEDKSILPRLGSPIFRLAISKDSQYVVTAHDDNALQIIDAQKTVVQVIQGLTQGHFQGTKNKNILPTGMLYDSHKKALVMNGRPGHLQFYNIQEDKQLFNLDITGRNFVSQDRDSVIMNTDVQKAAIDDKGHWLATTECWNDEKTSPQIWLKFWEFDIEKQTFVLNTNVILPHNKELNCILFQPNSLETGTSPLAVTTSNDCRFKIWMLAEDSDKKQSWSCESMGCYRDLPAGSACFSEDGSVLAVAFGSTATLWTVDTTALKAVLCHFKTKKNIEQLLFGRQSCSHLLVCHDASSITVWNALTLSIVWILHTEVQTMAGDPVSDCMAAFCKNQNLIIFNPSSPNPLFFMKNVSKERILSAVFVPTEVPKVRDSRCFYKNSQLFFFDEAQNLLTLTEESGESNTDDVVKETVNKNAPLTTFGRLQAEQKVSHVSAPESHELIINAPDQTKGIAIPSPTFQDPVALWSSIIPTLLIPAKKSQTIQPKKTSTDLDSNIQTGSDKSKPVIPPVAAQKLDHGTSNNTEPNNIGITDFSFLRECITSFVGKEVKL